MNHFVGVYGHGIDIANESLQLSRVFPDPSDEVGEHSLPQRFYLKAGGPQTSLWFSQWEGVRVLFKAEIYNRAELAQESGIESYAPEDWFAALYRKNGLDLLRRLRGKFCGIVLDESRDRCYLFTDQFSIMQLYYSIRGSKCYFSSSLQALSSLEGLSFSIDPEAVFQYVQSQVIPAPLTMYKEVRKLKPGHFMELSRSAAKESCYWDLVYRPGTGRRESECAEELLDRLDVAVTRTLKYDDLPVGAFLSGGLDSSTVAGFLSRKKYPSKVFSIGFAENGYDEMEFATDSAQHFGNEHYCYYVTPSDVAETAPRVAEASAEPFGNSSVIPTYLCSRLAGQHGVTVLLAGDGGDELFGGNSRYTLESVYQLYLGLPKLLRRGVVEPLVCLMPEENTFCSKAKKFITRASWSPLERYHAYSLFDEEFRGECFSPGFDKATRELPFFENWNRYYLGADAADHINRVLYADMKIVISDNDIRKVLLGSSMANIDVRFPLLDVDLVEFSLRLPPEMKVDRWKLRPFYRKAMQGFLSDKTLKKGKAGFGLPFSRWIKKYKNLRGLVYDVLLDPRTTERGYFRKGFFEKLIRKHEQDDTPYYGDNIWVYFMLEMWHRKHYDRLIPSET
jgi:asparagine synthase (glutamine-hydrolysing)